jgi:hypothetical protein
MNEDYLHESVVQLFEQLYVLVVYFDVQLVDEDHLPNYHHLLPLHQIHHLN